MPLKRRAVKTTAQLKTVPTNGTEKAMESRKMTPQLNAARPSSVAFLLAQMLFCLIGINLCFGWWSVKQERVIKKPYVLRAAHHTTSADAADGAPRAEKAFLTTAYGLMLSQTTTGCLVSAMFLGFHNIVYRLTHRSDAAAAAAASPPPPSAGDSTGENGQRRKGTLALCDVPELLAMGFSSIFGSSLGYAGMRRLSYPVALTAKMCKMLPVMLIGALWHHSRYPARKVLSCLVITCGVVVFALLDQRSSDPAAAAAAGKKNKTVDRLATSSSSLVGIALMVINLLMDGYTNSTQDVLVKRHGWSGPTLMLWANFISFGCALFVLSLLEFGEQPWTWLCSFVDLALTSCWRGAGDAPVHVASASLAFVPFHDLSHYISFLARSAEARYDVLLMSLLNSLGQLFIFHTISLFGALAVTAMTLLRKVGSVLLSIYVHGHPVQPSQWAALVTIFVGVVSEGYINVQDASKRQRERLASSVSPVRTARTATRETQSIAAMKATPGAESASAARGGAAALATTSPPVISSSSSSTAMMTDSRSATPMCAPV